MAAGGRDVYLSGLRTGGSSIKTGVAVCHTPLWASSVGGDKWAMRLGRGLLRCALF